ncbi:MAG: nucleotidyltransferase family protein [Filomicrobium sp.]
MVLAAGLGKRMRPLTDHKPKPMVPLAGRPLIDHTLDRLAKAGIPRAVVNVHYKADVLEDHLAVRRNAGQPPSITISDERGLLLETGGGIAKALPLLGRNPFLVCNSDTTWVEEPPADNLAALLAAWDPTQMDCLLLLAEKERSLGYSGDGDFHIDANGRLTRRQAGETTPHVFAGVSIARPESFKDAPQGPFSLNLLWDNAIAAERLFGIVMDGWWMHVGTPEALADADRFIAERAPRPGGTR